MIVTSKRCFLNVLTQLMPREALLKANYYIGDLKASYAKARVNNSVTYDTEGRLIEKNGVVNTNRSASYGGSYFIKQSRCLDPTDYTAKNIMGEDMNVRDEYVKYLNKPDTLLAVYNLLFKDPVEGNGLQILLMMDDENLLIFGHIICQYLSQMFGVDIMFIDPMYRDNCNGYPKYQGDKNGGLTLIENIRKWDSVSGFNQAIMQSSNSGSLSNIRTHLSCISMEELFNLYNQLFPEQPLPPGNYTRDMITEIIIGKTAPSLNITTDEDAISTINRSGLSNLNLINWADAIRRINDEIEYEQDYGDDDGIF